MPEPVIQEALFTLNEFDLSPITDTISANAPIIIGGGITLILTFAAINFVPRMIKKNVKG